MSTTSWHSYPSIYNLGHRALNDLFSDPVIVEEKVDGSQFSFGVFGGELRARSKGATLNIDAPEKMFSAGVATAQMLAPNLRDGWTYRGEYLQKPKHNTLAYDRIPALHVILFDINTGEETYLSAEEKAAEAQRLGLEFVPLLHNGMVPDAGVLLALLDRMSVLGGQKVEGIVIKNYARFGLDKKALMAKHVSEAFKEVHQGEWRKANPTRGDIFQELILQYRTPARWGKAVQHLRERGELESSPRDIGKLLKEVQIDVEKECREEIEARLFAYGWEQIRRGLTAGLPDWYKQQLLEGQFGTEPESSF